MKKKILSFISVLAFVLILFFVLRSVYNALRWKDTTGDYLSSFDQLYATENDLIDVVFVGPSHCYDSVYPAYLWEDAGIASFDMSVSGQDRDSSYHHLVEFLKTQKPKVVFFEVAALIFDQNDNIGNEYRNLLSMKPSVNSVTLVGDYLKRYGRKDEILDYTARFPIIHTRYRELDRKDVIPYEPNSFMRGEHIRWNAEEIEYWGSENVEATPAEFRDEYTEWLDKVYDLSVKEGFSLVLWAAPYQLSGYEKTLFEGVADYAADKGLVMLDMNRMPELGLDVSTDFFDTAHCNAHGAKKVSDYLAGYILENYDIPDHRGDAKYAQWDRDLEYVYRQKSIYDLSVTEDVNEYAKILSEMKDVSVIISLEGEYGRYYDDRYREVLSAFGISGAEYEKGGKWIYTGEECIKGHDNDLQEDPFYYTLGKYDTLKLDFEGDFLHPENVMIGHESYSNAGYCLLFVVYDDITKEVVSTGRF